VITTTITNLSPSVIEIYSPLLLLTPVPRLGRGEEDLIFILRHIKENLWKKLDNLPIKKSKCEQLIKELENIYEKIRKEKESQEKAGKPPKMSFGLFRSFGRRREELLYRLTKRGDRIYYREKYDI